MEVIVSSQKHYLTKIYQRVLARERITFDEARTLYYHAPLHELGMLANTRREQMKKDAYDGQGNKIVTYIVDRNINYTNVCDVYCKFCAFYRTELDRDKYVLSHTQIDEKIDALVALGGTQILMQGGHHPSLTIDFYLELLSHIKEKYPQINIHAFSPPEFNHFRRVFNMPFEEVIKRFKEAGLGSIPGGGGEILVDRVRQRISPRKCNSSDWLKVMEVAHGLGLKTTATMMFGHVETPEDRITHLQVVRDLQDRTGGFMAFICWPCQIQNIVLKLERRVGTHEFLRTQALSRIFLDNIPNMQSGWVTEGPLVAQLGLKFGANDFGSLMMEENVVSKAGAIFKVTLSEMQRLISEAGYSAYQRDSWYNLLNDRASTATSPSAAPSALCA